MPKQLLFPAIALLLLLTGCGGEQREDFPGAELVVQLRRVKSAKPLTAEQAKPYDEALVWQQYEVIKTIRGELPKRVTQMLVAQWCVVAEEDRTVDTGVGGTISLPLQSERDFPGIRDVKCTRPDDADPGLPQFIEAYHGKAKVPKQLRMDYGDIFSRQMRAYWETRPQLKVIILGNSHTGVGVEAGKLMLPENHQTPCVVSLAAPGSHMPFQCLLAKEYALDLPKLEWVVWGISPRSFNEGRKTNRRMDTFLASAGRNFDHQHWKELWPVPAAAPLSLADLRTRGFEPRDLWEYWSPKAERTFPVPMDDATRKALLAQMGKENSRWWSEAWDEFKATVKALTDKGIKVMLFTPPIHPLSQESVAVDADQTSRADLKMLIEKVQALDAGNDRVWFHDVNNGGKHDFAHEDFYDVDHLWSTGSQKLTQRLSDWMQQATK